MIKRLLKEKAGRIYLDYASLTPIDALVLEEINRYSTLEFANPASFYKEGVASKKALLDARIRVAKNIGALADEIFFTSGGTESNNIAIVGAIEKLREQGVEYKDMHVIASVIEHSSIRECLNQLSERDVKIDFIKVDINGIVDLEHLEKMIRPNTVIVSVMTVNNEIGSIQPIRDIARIVRHARKNNSEASPYNFQSVVEYPLLHTDAAQAPVCLELNVEKLGVDLLTLDGTKMYGPRGIGALYVKRNTPITPIQRGGGQEGGLRPGTENIPAIMGLAKALDLVSLHRAHEVKRVSDLKRMFIEGLKSTKSTIVVNGGEIEKPGELRMSPFIVNVTIPGIDSEFFLLELDAKGIACSTKSSCLRDEDESYVLKSIGANSKNSLRFSFGRFTEESHIKKTLDIVRQLLSR